MITNGYLKSTVHAVQHPPPDQDKFNRLALLYFPRLADEIQLQARFWNASDGARKRRSLLLKLLFEVKVSL